jgi:hypothetical protein
MAPLKYILPKSLVPPQVIIDSGYQMGANNKKAPHDTVKGFFVELQGSSVYHLFMSLFQ